MKTPEERQARREKVRQLHKMISGFTQARRDELAAKYGIVTVDGHPLSVYNQCLIISQAAGSVNPTVIGGYRQWLRAGRQVQKGETGYLMWVPARSKDHTEDRAEQELDEANEVGTRFLLVSVFDISQTAAVDATPGTQPERTPEALAAYKEAVGVENTTT